MIREGIERIGYWIWICGQVIKITVEMIPITIFVGVMIALQKLRIIARPAFPNRVNQGKPH
jgi:hypothetical protein